MNNRPLTPEAFAAWLATQDDLPGGRCPLSHYLGTTVGLTLYTTSVSPPKANPLPGWAVHFISRMDFANYDDKAVVWGGDTPSYSARLVERVLAETLAAEPRLAEAA